MGKASKLSPTGRFRLYKTNRHKDGQPLVVQMEYSYKSIAVRRATGITVKEKDWNPKENNGRGGLKPSYGPDYRNINNRLLKKVSDFDTKIREWVEAHPRRLTISVIRALIVVKPSAREDKGIDFTKLVTVHLKNEDDRHKIGQSVYTHGLSSMNIFSQF